MFGLSEEEMSAIETAQNNWWESLDFSTKSDIYQFVRRNCQNKYLIKACSEYDDVVSVIYRKPSKDKN